MSKRFFIVTVLGLAIVGAAILFLYLGNGIPSILNDQLGLQDTKTQTNPVDGKTALGLPARLIIPAIKVDAPVIYVGLAADGSVDVPKGPDEVAWFQLGPRPGQEGSAVITGHFGPWQTGASSVFDHLHQLKEGDMVSVKDDTGATFSFKVIETRIYQAGQSPPEVFNKSDGKYLNLITCNGDWLKNEKTYTQRLVVFTEAVT